MSTRHYYAHKSEKMCPLHVKHRANPVHLSVGLKRWMVRRRRKTNDLFGFYSFVLLSSDNHQKTMINCTTTPTICQMNLLSVNRWHHGIYECVASNSIATIGRFYELDVQCKYLGETKDFYHLMKSFLH